MQFLHLLDVKKRGSLRFISVDVKQNGIFGIDEIPPVVQEMLNALSLAPDEKGKMLNAVRDEIVIKMSTDAGAGRDDC